MDALEGSIAYANGAVLFGVISTILLNIWSKSKAKKSVYRDQNSFEEIGVTFLSSLFNTSRSRFIDGRVELHPTGGVRIVTLMLLGMISYLSYMGIYHNHPWTAELPIDAHILILLLLHYSCISVWFIQRVNYDEQPIQVRGVDLFAQKRDLSGLESIEKHPKKSAVILNFKTRKKLNVPSYLSQMNRFLTDMETVIDRNMKAGR